MLRTSLSVHGRLMRVQAVRQKRDAIEGAATEDAWAAHVAEQSMLRVVDPKPKSLKTARPEAARGESPVGVPTAGFDQSIEENVSENGIISHDAAFETSVSEQPLNRGAKELNKRETMAVSLLTISRLRGRELPATGRESPGRMK